MEKKFTINHKLKIWLLVIANFSYTYPMNRPSNSNPSSPRTPVISVTRSIGGSPSTASKSSPSQPSSGSSKSSQNTSTAKSRQPVMLVQRTINGVSNQSSKSAPAISNTHGQPNQNTSNHKPAFVPEAPKVPRAKPTSMQRDYTSHEPNLSQVEIKNPTRDPWSETLPVVPYHDFAKPTKSQKTINSLQGDDQNVQPKLMPESMKDNAIKLLQELESKKNNHEAYQACVFDHRYEIARMLKALGYPIPDTHPSQAHFAPPAIGFILAEGPSLIRYALEASMAIAGAAGAAWLISGNNSELDCTKEIERINSNPKNIKQSLKEAKKRYQRDYGYEFNMLSTDYADRVYSPSEVKEMRQRGIDSRILTLEDERGAFFDQSPPIEQANQINAYSPIGQMAESEDAIRNSTSNNEVNSSQLLSTITPNNQKTGQKEKSTERNTETKSSHSSATGGSPDPEDPWGGKNRQNSKNKKDFKERKENKISKKEFFEKVKPDYEYWKDGIYKKTSKAESLAGAEYLQWDHLHNDVEAYNSSYKHLGSIDPETLKLYKPAVPSRKINK
ncbi:MAG TPA: colicin E3/pyocin S6 family cytotoxin [Candidatus Babeliales bacterium]|nr:colicin E3/pyocin S6 family cytotoxin [Candidatus Babeliales bacterium]